MLCSLTFQFIDVQFVCNLQLIVTCCSQLCITCPIGGHLKVKIFSSKFIAAQVEYGVFPHQLGLSQDIAPSL
jgi:hypothetical protein